MGSTRLLEVSGLGKSFSGISVLHEVSFGVDPGEAVAIVGPNGAGKSTLLHCLTGNDVPDEGTILLGGVVLDEASASTRAAMACLLDDIDFFPELSVVEHLRLYAWAHGTDRADLVVDDLIDELRLATVRDQLPATLSSGQRHRLGLASCLVRPRKLLALDEPEQRLDVSGRMWLSTRLNQEKRSGTGIVFATHSSKLVDEVADTIVEIDG